MAWLRFPSLRSGPERQSAGPVAPQAGRDRDSDAALASREQLRGGERDRITDLEAALARSGDLLCERERRIAELETLADRRGDLLLQREKQLVELEAAARARDGEIAALRQRTARERDRLIPLGRDSLLVHLDGGGRLVVPTWNMDVGVGLIRDGVIEAWTTAAVRAILKPGQTIVNVGANLGYYLILGAVAVGPRGRAIGIEANRALFPYLFRSVYWSGVPNTARLFNCAASDADGLPVELLFDPQYMGGTGVTDTPAPSSLAASGPLRRDGAVPDDALWETADISHLFDEHGEWRRHRTIVVRGRCETRRIDTILHDIPAIDLMLLDIEGGEPRAILGTERLIRRSPDLSLILEWSPASVLAPENIRKTDDMIGLLDALGYRFFRIRHQDFSSEQALPSLTPLRDKTGLYATPHGDVLVCRDPDAVVEGWSTRFVAAE